MPSTTFGPGGQRLFAENTRAGERLASQWPVPAAAALYESFALSTPTRQDREAQTVHATIRQMLGNRTLHGPRRMRRAVMCPRRRIARRRLSCGTLVIMHASAQQEQRKEPGLRTMAWRP